MLTSDAHIEPVLSNQSLVTQRADSVGGKLPDGLTRVSAASDKTVLNFYILCVVEGKDQRFGIWLKSVLLTQCIFSHIVVFSDRIYST